MVEIAISHRPPYHSDREDQWEAMLEACCEDILSVDNELITLDAEAEVLGRKLWERGFHTQAKVRKLCRSDGALSEKTGFQIEEFRARFWELGFRKKLNLFDRLIAGKGEHIVEETKCKITSLEDLNDLDVDFEPPKTVRATLYEMLDASLRELRPLADKYFAIKNGKYAARLEKKRDRAFKKLNSSQPHATQPDVMYLRR